MMRDPTPVRSLRPGSRVRGSSILAPLSLAAAVTVASSAQAQAPAPAPSPAPTYQPPKFTYGGGSAPPGAAPPPGAPGAPPPGAPPPEAPPGGWTPAPGGPPPGVYQSPPRRLERPTSIEEFNELRKRLKDELDDARDDDRDADARRIREELDDVEAWYDEDTEKRSGGAMAGGIVMISLGGVSIVIGAFTLMIAGISSSLGGGSDGAEAFGAITLVSGLGLVGGGIPLLIYGSKRVMVVDNALAPRAPEVAPHAAVVFGPGSLRFEGSF
jgi:hypothetical protein